MPKKGTKHKKAAQQSWHRRIMGGQSNRADGNWQPMTEKEARECGVRQRGEG